MYFVTSVTCASKWLRLRPVSNKKMYIAFIDENKYQNFLIATFIKI